MHDPCVHPHRSPFLRYIHTLLEKCVDHVCNYLQDAREMLAELRELKFALEESKEAAASLQSELAAAKVKHILHYAQIYLVLKRIEG